MCRFDPEYPQDRIDYILTDTQVSLVLSQRGLLQTGNVHLPEDKVLYIDLTEELYQQEYTEDPQIPGHILRSGIRNLYIRDYR